LTYTSLKLSISHDNLGLGSGYIRHLVIYEIGRKRHQNDERYRNDDVFPVPVFADTFQHLQAAPFVPLGFFPLVRRRPRLDFDVSVHKLLNEVIRERFLLLPRRLSPSPGGVLFLDVNFPEPEFLELGLDRLEAGARCCPADSAPVFVDAFVVELLHYSIRFPTSPVPRFRPVCEH